ncbi:M48 family metalloprotease [Crossiella sp. CA-258035]|uniref:M48 family metalloprotease n=1 Tax=Crossiella sp. CA-258035 TaxID=2981138 RepID=UPI0024BD24B5|nr:M48 family metalloprotease [Crossiella sp. CA-258035]WHT22523.1 M48 family metalloprotease [Crossiella sp. CA-258035]
MTAASPVLAGASTSGLAIGTTRARYALLIAVPIILATYAGSLLHNGVFRLQRIETLKRCYAEAVASAPADVLARGVRLGLCNLPGEVARVSSSAVVGVVVAALGLVLLRRLPVRLYRRTGRVRRAGERWQRAAADAVHSMGGAVVPEVVFASACREAFTVRIGGRPRVVLPNGVLALPADEAEALLRHECAHVVAGDVGRVWLTRGLWWATPAVLVLPLVFAVVLWASGRPFTTDVWTAFNRDYLIRSVALLALVWLVSRGLLRAREHEADLVSSANSGPSALRALLSRQRPGRGGRIRELLSLHPSSSRRLAVLDRGRTTEHARGVEGFAFGALATALLLVGALHFNPLFAGIGNPVLSYNLSVLATALLPGVLLGYAWGTTVWQSADDRRPWQRRVLDALGLPVGVLVGLLLALTEQGSFWHDEAALETWVVISVVLTGAAALCAAIATLHRRGGPTAWIGGLIAVLFTGAVIPAQTAALLLRNGGVEVFTAQLTLSPPWVLLAGQCAAAAVVWWWSRGHRRLLLVVTGVTTAVVVAARLLLAEPLSQANAYDQSQTEVLIAAGAGVVVVLPLVALRGRTGLALGIAASWTTTLLICAALITRYEQPLEVVYYYAVPSLSLLAAALLVLAVVTIPLRGHVTPPGSRGAGFPVT